jgi:hypothetical protein
MVRASTRALWFCAVLIGNFALNAFAQTTSLQAPWQKKAFGDAFSLAERIFPRIDHGYLLSFRPTIQRASHGDIVLQSLVTGETRQLTFWFGGASEIHIAAASINKAEERVYVAGSYVRQADIAVTDFIAELDLTGHIVRTFGLGLYRPRRICAADDGTLWTLGQVLNENGEDSGAASGMLRNYSVNGQLLNAYLPGSEFPVVSRNIAKKSRVFLSCGDESVGVYLGPARRWIEIPFGGGAAQQWQIEPPQSAPTMTHLTLLGKGTVYASFRNRESSASNAIYGINRGPNGEVRWTRISQKLRVGAKAVGKVLMGRDGPSVVYLERTSSELNPTLYWSKP